MPSRVGDEASNGAGADTSEFDPRKYHGRGLNEVARRETAGLTQMGGLVDHYPGEMLRKMRQDERHAETVVTVPSMRLDTLLRAHGLDRIDYCSIDVEGAERAVLRSIDFEATDIAVLSIENNRSGPEPASYEDIMGPTDYRQVAVLGMDEIWVKRAE